MITNDVFERTVSNWLHADAEDRVPDHLDAVLRLTSSERQRPAWSSLERWLPMDLATRATMVASPRFVRAALVVLLLIALFGVAILVAGSRQQRLPAPFGPAANGAILYTANGDIYRSDPSGSDPRVLVGGPDIELGSAISNDGTKFAFLREVATDSYNVLTADVDGRGIRSLTDTPLSQVRSAEWSPDGSHLLVLHSIVDQPTISILSTGADRSIVHSRLGPIVPEAPQWRPPDGREIVFRGSSFDGVALYAVGQDGADPRPVAPPMRDDGAYLGPRLAPDGDRVTFWHNRPALTAEGRKAEVHVLNLQTQRDIVIGYDPNSRHELLPKFSPDGTSILFVRFVGRQDAFLMIAPADGTGVPRQIGPSQTGYGANPIVEFSPDGQKILVTYGPDSRLQVIDVASGSIETGEYADWPGWVRLAP